MRVSLSLSLVISAPLCTNQSNLHAACLSTVVKVKQSGGVTKFKVRCSRYLYTMSLSDSAKAAKLRQSLPPNLTVQEAK